MALSTLVKEIKGGTDGRSGGARSFVVELLEMTEGGTGDEWWEAAATVLARDEKQQILTRGTAL
ncbi:MAG: hypothetical protein E6J91_37540 [Deltaproteobacteria bacterium]|nr:MAG: hypothetical protein E6J91_37540 [Deltaproteobacteria bacterium]